MGFERRRADYLPGFTLQHSLWISCKLGSKTQADCMVPPIHCFSFYSAVTRRGYGGKISRMLMNNGEKSCMLQIPFLNPTFLLKRGRISLIPGFKKAPSVSYPKLLKILTSWGAGCCGAKQVASVALPSFGDPSKPRCEQ